VEAKYPALLFKQQLDAFVQKIFPMLRDNVKKEITPQLAACIHAPRTATATARPRATGERAGASPRVSGGAPGPAGVAGSVLCCFKLRTTMEEYVTYTAWPAVWVCVGGCRAFGPAMPSRRSAVLGGAAPCIGAAEVVHGLYVAQARGPEPACF
jgi:hypothetical protein